MTALEGTVATKAETSTVEALAARVGTAEGTIAGHTGDIAAINTALSNKANVADVYTKTEIGTIAEGKTIVQMIADAQTAATYDDTAVRGLINNNTTAIEAIYKAGEGEAAATGVLAEEIDRAKKAEQDNANAIAALTEQVGNVSNIMNFRGVIDKEAEGFNAEDPFASITDPQPGDVVILGEQEYVYSNNTWVLFGDATGNAAAITALAERVEANETAVNTTLPGAITRALADAKTYTDEQMANYTVKSVVSGHEALVINSADGVVTIGFAEELILNGGTAV